MIKPGDTILFQGDSITDAKRNMDVTEANDRQALGSGYCNYIAARLLAERPSASLKLYNRGISGTGLWICMRDGEGMPSI